MHKRHPPPNKDIPISKCQACWSWETLVQKEEGYPEDRLSALPDFGAVYCPEAENVAFIFKTENATIGFSVILAQDTVGQLVSSLCPKLRSQLSKLFLIIFLYAV